MEKIKIQIFGPGPGCGSCIMMQRNIEEATDALKINAEIKHNTDSNETANLGITLVPSLVIDGKLVSHGKKLDLDEVKNLLKEWGQNDKS